MQNRCTASGTLTVCDIDGTAVSSETDLLAFADRMLTGFRPQRLLLIGPAAADLAACVRRLQPAVDVQVLPAATAAALEGRQPADLAIVIDALEQLPHGEVGVLLARLRDLYARRIVASLRTSSPSWTHADMIGHGFVRLDGVPAPTGPAQLYEFDIGTYKTTPDWLNSESWANPQLFDKHRW